MDENVQFGVRRRIWISVWTNRFRPQTSACTFRCARFLEQVRHDPDGDSLSGLMIEWHAAFGSTPTTVRKAVEAALYNQPSLLDAIRELPVEVYDTSNFPNQFSDMNGNAFVLTGLPPATSHGRTQIWITFDQMLFRTGPGPNQGLTVLGAYSHDSPDNSLYQHFVWVGMLYSGFWKARPDDRIGLAFTYYQVSPNLTSTVWNRHSACCRPISLGFRRTRWCWRPTIVSRSIAASRFSPNSSGSFVPAACRRYPMPWCSA
jgi:hypothetical protein